MVGADTNKILGIFVLLFRASWRQRESTTRVNRKRALGTGFHMTLWQSSDVMPHPFVVKKNMAADHVTENQEHVIFRFPG